MQNNERSNPSKQSSTGAQSQQPQKQPSAQPLNQPNQKGSNSSRVDQSDDNFGTSQSTRGNK
ncbi:MAG: hypothetical protein EOP10_25105 [Proteobacteria bacterium]|nr:MAG: hypothetical protein EOP10_25105 [Pseudomonadota bacterium]